MSTLASIENNKHIALSFLQAARAGDRVQANKHLSQNARHHNPYFAAGMPVLLDAIAEASQQFPESQFEAKCIIAEQDYVTIHSHVRHQPQDAGFAAVHIFRFEGDSIAEMWDLSIPIPENNPNTDGMF